MDNIIPFGKHKGKTVEEVEIIEPGYLEWLTGQNWFRERYVVLHQTIINHGAEPEETPDHNALQALFLDDAFCLKVVAALGYNPEKEFNRRKQEEIARTQNRIQEQQAFISGQERSDYFRTYTEKEIEKLKLELASQQATSYRHEIRRTFEVRGIDVELGVAYGGHFRIEIKPAVGDDYPAVLRQMRRTGSEVLFLERYTGVGATLEQFKAIFKSAGISIVFREQIK